MPFKDHTGTIIRRGRVLFAKVWVVDLDQASGLWPPGHRQSEEGAEAHSRD